MPWQCPAPVVVWRAIDAYLAVAYDGPAPAPVAERLAKLRAAADGAFYECEVFERADERCALRLGNRFYPHMKLVMVPAPDGRVVFRADTHDRHFVDLIQPSDTRFAELLARNEAIARAIEDAWSACGLLTLRECMREQIATWRAART
jgi:hypothetical protein